MNTCLKLILALVAVLAVNTFEPGHEKESFIFAKFQTFLKEHNKKYTTIEEYTARFTVFKKNYERMELFSLSENKSHRVGVTKFMDLTTQEFRRTYLNLNITLLQALKAKSEVFEIPSDVVAPAEFDWRAKGAVGAVKDQGQCGSCWAFSAVANLEGLQFIKSGKSVVLSEQQLVDCDKVDSGCNGGLMENAFNYVKGHGLGLAAEYPYRARGGSCKKVESHVAVKGFHFAGTDNEEEIKKFVATTGPVSIALNAGTLQFYDGGVIDADENECNPQEIDHGVAIVGYGTENGQQYWLVRNSWGQNWGENGYFRVALGKGVCGVNTYVVSADLA